MEEVHLGNSVQVTHHPTCGGRADLLSQVLPAPILKGE